MSDKTRKYLLYALGEIFLVVIGILIALQVNNWNENRKASAEQEIILKNLNTEFSENLVELNLSIRDLDSLSEALDELLQIMRDQPDTLNQNSFELLLQRTFFTPTYAPSSFVIEELKNSGGLTRLDNDHLETLLLDFERHSASLRFRETGFRRYANQYIDHLTEFGSVRNLDSINGRIPTLRKSTITKNSLDMVKNPVFENRADNFYFLAHLVRTGYAETAIKMAEIIRITEN